MKFIVPPLALCASLLPAAASAQTPTAAPPSQEFTFTDQLVQASLVRPEEATARNRRRYAGPSLLRIRAHFVPEMLRSVERL